MAYFIIPVMATAIINWVASDRGWRKTIYITKPLTMILIILWFTLITCWQGDALWFGLGLIFSLAGDIFLMLPNDRFLAGLASFLTAHVMYILGLNYIRHPVTVPSGLVALLVLFLLLSMGWIFYRNIRRGEQPQFLIPVLVYLAVISTMLLSAVLCLVNRDWQPLNALLVASGAVSFFLSDSIIGWNRFIQPIEHDRLKVMSTYHLGQLGIIVGAMLQLTG